MKSPTNPRNAGRKPLAADQKKRSVAFRISPANIDHLVQKYGSVEKAILALCTLERPDLLAQLQAAADLINQLIDIKENGL